VVPATLEVLLVHLADLAEARVEAALAATERANDGADWTAYVPELGAALRVPVRGTSGTADRGEAWGG
jgi:hypothetical protein